MPFPRTAAHTLREPAQSKCTSTCHKSQKFTGKMPQTKTAPQTLCEPAQSKRMSRFHKSRFIHKFTGKMPQTKTAPQTLCESAQAKSNSTFHKSHFIRKFTGKMLRLRVSTLMKHRPLLLPQKPFSVDTVFWEKTCDYPLLRAMEIVSN